MAELTGKVFVVVTTMSLAQCLGGCTSVISPAPASVSSAGVDEAYTLSVGDRVSISTFNEPTLSGEFQIGGSGTISFPLIGEVAAQNKSARELQAALSATLRTGYVLDPRVTVEVLNFRPFFILGEIERPGRYPTFEGMTVTRAIATAGGFTSRADTNAINIRKRGETVGPKVRISDDTRIEPGDVLRLGERYF